MTFNKDLFFELCEEYGVKFSKNYETIMLCDDDGSVRELCEEDIDIIFSPETENISYNYSDYWSINTDTHIEINERNFLSEDLSSINLLPENFLCIA